VQLRPKPGFDPSLINWGGPDEPPSDECSYCDAPLPDPESPDYDIPLTMWNQDGWCARFCAACMTRWWGFEPSRAAAPPFSPLGTGREGPGYWMAETTGVLRPAVEAYLTGAPLTEQQIAMLRAYLRQWIFSPVWDRNPHASPAAAASLAKLRAGISKLTSRDAIDVWIHAATASGLDPL
jgi:hypothetical protein